MGIITITDGAEHSISITDVVGDSISVADIAGDCISISPPGASITPGDIGALAIAVRLGEFDTEQKKIAARTNLGIQIIDAGSF